MPLEVTSARYTPAWVQDQWAKRRALVVYGDNMLRRGEKGQSVIRQCRNAVGIATKRLPSMDADAFFTDRDLHRWWQHCRPDLNRLQRHVADNGLVLWPAGGIGTGLAELDTRAPAIYAAVQEVRYWLARGADLPFIDPSPARPRR